MTARRISLVPPRIVQDGAEQHGGRAGARRGTRPGTARGRRASAAAPAGPARTACPCPCRAPTPRTGSAPRRSCAPPRVTPAGSPTTAPTASPRNRTASRRARRRARGGGLHDEVGRDPALGPGPLEARAPRCSAPSRHRRGRAADPSGTKTSSSTTLLKSALPSRNGIGLMVTPSACRSTTSWLSPGGGRPPRSCGTARRSSRHVCVAGPDLRAGELLAAVDLRRARASRRPVAARVRFAHPDANDISPRQMGGR